SRAYARADPEKGRFRSFLVGALKHFLAHARAHDRRQKRGGGMILGQLDTAAIAEADARAVSLQTWSAERGYERGWAERVLGRRHLCQALAAADECRHRRLARRSVLIARHGWREDSPAISGAA